MEPPSWLGPTKHIELFRKTKKLFCFPLKCSFCFSENTLVLVYTARSYNLYGLNSQRFKNPGKSSGSRGVLYWSLPPGGNLSKETEPKSSSSAAMVIWMFIGQFQHTWHGTRYLRDFPFALKELTKRLDWEVPWVRLFLSLWIQSASIFLRSETSKEWDVGQTEKKFHWCVSGPELGHAHTILTTCLAREGHHSVLQNGDPDTP